MKLTIDNMKYELVEITDPLTMIAQCIGKSLHKYHHKDYGELILCDSLKTAYIIKVWKE